ncbi:MAG: hypothetical protein IJ650_01770 [Paludibacteraceae bacterium]|nr:hypothetical protein [Paludibacteraceae bacterium]
MKKFIEIWSIVFGSLIVVAGFVVDPTGVVHSSVLYVFAICIVNAAALEGVELLKVMDYFKLRKEDKNVTDSDS